MNGPLLTSNVREAQVGDELWIDGFMSASRSPQCGAECAVEKYGDTTIFIEVLPALHAETITLPNEMHSLCEYESIFDVPSRI